MIKNYNKVAYLFPGQGSQYVEMGKKFFDSFSIAKEVFEYSDHLLNRNLSKIIFEGPEYELTETKNSQLGIFIVSTAILKVLKKEIPLLTSDYCAGLSLGEYSALHASEHLSFEETLHLVNYRATFMNEACERSNGTMAVIIGLTSEEVKMIVQEANLPADLWVANFNCPGQVVISGTQKGIDRGILLAKEKGAKRILPLSVHGAFHSGLMTEAKQKLTPYIENSNIVPGKSKLVMNVTGNIESEINLIKKNLIDQVTHSVQWELCIKTMSEADLFIEIGPGKTLAAFNKRIGVRGQTISIENPKDLEIIYNLLA